MYKFVFLILLVKILGCGNPITQQVVSVKTDSAMLAKTDQMMDENQFWQLVSNSLQNTHSQEAQEKYLIKELEKLSPTEIIGFRLRTDKLLYDTYQSDMWCAAYIINGGCSDDGFEYFRCWLISQGKETYQKAKANPDYLVNVIEEGEGYEFESFWYVALAAFKNKTGKDLYDHIDDNFTTREGNYPPLQFTWEEDKPETMKKVCPGLFEKVAG